MHALCEATPAAKAKKWRESLFFFFFRSNPVAVQVDSRLHCNYIAIHSG
jgi:hypothetical protein